MNHIFDLGLIFRNVVEMKKLFEMTLYRVLEILIILILTIQN